MVDDPSVPVAVALRLGSFAVATDLRTVEPPGDTRDRMAAALSALDESLRKEAGEFYVSGAPIDLSSLMFGASVDDRRAFLIEQCLAMPFAPYWFPFTKARERERLKALQMLAYGSLGLDPDDVTLIHARWNALVKAESGIPWEKLAKPLVAGVAVAAVAVAAGPMIATLMPAASGLNGAAAVSAGLAQLGFGSVAAGGLGMTGGLWMLGLAGTTLGAGGSALAQGLQEVVRAPGSGHVIEQELRKLILSADLSVHARWFGQSIEKFDDARQALEEAIEGELDEARQCNDPKAPRVLELEKLYKVSQFAGQRISDLYQQSESSSGE